MVHALACTIKLWSTGKFGEHERSVRVARGATLASWVLSKLPKCSITRQCTAKSMNQLFYNIAGGIEHQIRREKRTTISEVIVRVKRNIMQNRNWFYFEFSVESSSFIFNNFKTEKFKLTFEGWNRPVCHLFGFTRVSFCQNLLHFTLGEWSESWRRWWRVSSSVVFLFFCLI